MQQKLRSIGFKDAFVVAYKGEKRINLKDQLNHSSFGLFFETLLLVSNYYEKSGRILDFGKLNHISLSFLYFPLILLIKNQLAMSRETKIGILAVITIALSIWGYKFIKGKNILSTSQTFYIDFDNVLGLKPSTPVTVRGLQVGSVIDVYQACLLYTSPSPRDATLSRMPSSA